MKLISPCSDEKEVQNPIPGPPQLSEQDSVPSTVITVMLLTTLVLGISLISNPKALDTIQ